MNVILYSVDTQIFDTRIKQISVWSMLHKHLTHSTNIPGISESLSPRVSS